MTLFADFDEIFRCFQSEFRQIFPHIDIIGIWHFRTQINLRRIFRDSRFRFDGSFSSTQATFEKGDCEQGCKDYYTEAAKKSCKKDDQECINKFKKMAAKCVEEKCKGKVHNLITCVFCI